MIDEKKIEEAARLAADLYEQDLPIMSYYENTEVDGQHHFCQEFGAELFKDGVKWAIEQFLKDLWHDVSEKPRNAECLLELNVKWNANSEIEKVYIVDWFGSLGFEGRELKRLLELNTEVKLSRWLYVDDLLPKKKGGEK